MLQIFMDSGKSKGNDEAAKTDCAGLLQVLRQCKKFNMNDRLLKKVNKKILLDF